MKGYDCVETMSSSFEPAPSGHAGAQYWARKITVFVCLAMLIVVWILQALFIKQSDYQQWFFMVYFVHSLYAIFIPVWYVWSRFSNKPISTLDWPSICCITTFFAAIYLVCGVTWYISQPLTPVSENTAITNTACAAVWILSVMFLREPIKLKAVGAMLMSMLGVWLVYKYGQVKSDDATEQATAAGYILVTVSTLIYAVYQVLYSKYGNLYASLEKTAVAPAPASLLAAEDAPLLAHTGNAIVGDKKPARSTEDEILNSMLFLGMMGVMCLFLFWVFFPIFHVTGIEKFVLPNPHQWKMLLAMGTVATLFDILILICISLSSPFYVSVASMLSIPAGMLADYVVYGYTLPVGSTIGVVCMVLGFAGLTF